MAAENSKILTAEQEQQLRKDCKDLPAHMCYMGHKVQLHLCCSHSHFVVQVRKDKLLYLV